MQRLLAALRASKPAHLPRLGLRLVNGLAEPRPPAQFWQHYVRTVLDPGTFDRLSPHSKCLLTCVACKLTHDEAMNASAHSMVERVFRDVTTPKALPLLNIELLTMIMVASHTLRIPLGRQELQRILQRSQELMERESYFNVELSVSFIHSLGAVVRVHPMLREQIASSELVRNVVTKLPDLIPRVNLRELSLVLYAFDKLRIIKDKVATTVMSRLNADRDNIRGQTLSTILYACAVHPSLQPALRLLTQNVTDEADTLTGRMVCNICCAYLKAGLWKQKLAELLENALPKMNAQELCNVANLMMHKSVDVTESFKSAYVTHFNNSVVKLRLSLLDALTLTQSISHWGLTDRVDRPVLDEVLTKTIEADITEAGAKHVYLLHYCVIIGCASAASAVASRIDQNLDYEPLSNKEIVVLFNALHNLGSKLAAISKVEGALKGRLAQRKRFSQVDLQTMAHWGNYEICNLIVEHHLEELGQPSRTSFRLLGALLKVTKSEKAKTVARQAIELVLPPRDTDSPFNEHGRNVDIIVAACELLPHLQVELSVLVLFDKTLSYLTADGGTKWDIDMRSLITLLSVARKLNTRSDAVSSIAYAVTRRVDGTIDPSGFLEYLNAVYHLDLPMTPENRILDIAGKVMTAARDDRIKESIVLALLSMAFGAVFEPASVHSLVTQHLATLREVSTMGLKSIYITLATGGTLSGAMYPAVLRAVSKLASERNFPCPSIGSNLLSKNLDGKFYGRSQTPATDVADPKLHSSVYATLRKMQKDREGFKTLLAEVPVAFDYVADILLIPSSTKVSHVGK
ncbi:uncharacterized protein BXIN_1129 [Babesia sp. Xinjiang]|uniref:uncharacterized protein n=1 Tax=Babesia sp. Xinjiang TaxID=462227 RepID=UPI000A24C3F6|nr:uncharacterized protein BXIN_1129 [Babesia sp. Xinjiang]ORM42357.1 hypothetical protein BXIN_1129 [Babesia sp. Xinjiang]